MGHIMWRWDTSEESRVSNGPFSSVNSGTHVHCNHLCAHTHTHTHTLRRYPRRGAACFTRALHKAECVHALTQRGHNPLTEHPQVCMRYSGQTGTAAHVAGTHLVGGHRCLPPASLARLQVTELPDNPCLEGRMVNAPMVWCQIHFLSIAAPQSWFPSPRGTLKSATRCSNVPREHVGS